MANSLKVLRLSHSSGVSAYRERDRQLIKQFDVDLRLIIPESWRHLGDDFEVPKETFDVIKARTFGTGSIPLFAYDPSCIAKTLTNFKPDVVDIHEEPYSVSCFEITKLVELFHPSAAVVFYSAQNIRKQYPIPFAWSEQYVYGRANGAYPCSGGVKEVLLQKGFKKSCEVIPLGVDTQAFKPNPLQSGDEIVVGYFGRLEEYKGVDTLVRAVAKLNNDLRWRLLLVGDGAYRSTLQTLAVECDVSDKIDWVGEIKSSEIPNSINKCHVVVIPSKTTKTWMEQFGRAATEAMACGVPVIVSDSGSLSEVVGDAGIVVPEQNVEGLASALTQLITNSERRLELARRSLERVLNNYTWEKVAAQMFVLYENALIHKDLQRHI